MKKKKKEEKMQKKKKKKKIKGKEDDEEEVTEEAIKGRKNIKSDACAKREKMKRCHRRNSIRHLILSKAVYYF